MPTVGTQPLKMGTVCVLSDYALPAVFRVSFEKPALYRVISGDHRRGFVAAKVAMDVDREPLAAGMRRAGKAPRDRRPGRTAGEEHRSLAGSVAMSSTDNSAPDCCNQPSL